MDKTIKNVLSYLYKVQNTHDKTLGIILSLLNIAKSEHDPVKLQEGILKVLSLELGLESVSLLKYNPETGLLELTGFKTLFEHFNNGIVTDTLYQPPYSSISQANPEFWNVFETKEPLFADAQRDDFVIACLPIGEFGLLMLTNSASRPLSIREKRNLNIIAQLVSLFLDGLLNDPVKLTHVYIQRIVDAKIRGIASDIKRHSDIRQILKDIIKDTPQGVVVIDKELKVFLTNKAFSLMTGFREEEINFSDISRIFPDNHQTTSLTNSIKEGKLASFHNFFLLNNKREFITTDIFFHPITLSYSSPVIGMLIVHDLRGDAKRLEEMVSIEKMKALSLMAKGIAHDFNNILAMILGNVEILIEDSETSKKNDFIKRLKNIQEVVIKGKYIVQRLNAYVGMRGSARPYVRKLDTAVENALDYISPRLKELSEKNGILIRIIRELSYNGPVHIVEDDLKETLINLLLNSIDAMPDGGDIEITTKQEENYAQICVKDSGEGIPDEYKDKIFDPFFTTKGVKSSGLGLSIALSMIHRAQGTIMVNSLKDRGTSFIIRLPIAKGDDITATIKSPLEPLSQSNIAKLNILIVDDEEVIVDLLSTVLKNMGHNVEGVSDPVTAKNMITKKGIDLLLTDIGMPVINGFELASYVKEVSPETKIVFITGWGDHYSPSDLSEKGIDGLLSKPFKIDDLKNIIQKIFCPL